MSDIVYPKRPLGEDPQVGQVWRWHADRDGIVWDELWILIGNDYPNPNAFQAFQLETGEFNSVFPIHSPEDWERVA